VPVTSMVLSEPSDTVPERVLVPVLVFSVPPLSIMASAPTLTPWRSRLAPLATVVSASVVPNAAAFESPSVPALTVVAPV